MRQTFSQLFKKYRLRSEFETLREFADALAEKGAIYDESVFSHWQKGTRMPHDRRLLLDILGLFIKRGGIFSLESANEFLQSADQGFLTSEEITQLSNDSLRPFYFYEISKYIWRYEKTIQTEKNAISVWVITPDFYWDVNSSLWSKIVMENIKKGVRYFYIYKKSDATQSAIQTFIKKLISHIGEEWHNSVHFLPLPADNFPWFTDHVLYNPGDQKNEHYIIVSPMGNTGNLDGFDIECMEEYRMAFRQYFTETWNKRVKDPYWKIG